MEELYLGAAYYPELRDESEIDKDIARCKELGINLMRVGEFAWSKMEPEEGVFEFGWVKNVVRKLHAAGIGTLLCTPTCTPPRWMLNKYPEIRMVNSGRVREDVSSRCHPCKTSQIMREKNRAIVTEMAKALANETGVVGWQIDNELFPYDEGCRCELCKSAFRRYLKEKFHTSENLNRAWGMSRWSLEYSSFEEVEPPYPNQWKHPSLRKAWWDFQCSQIKSYSDEQAAILHKYGCTNVGTDMMATNALSYYKMCENLDVVQYNHYNPAEDLPETAFAYDFLRCVKDKPFWVTETQVGWNGSEYAEFGYRPEGNCYANTMLPFARGAQMNEYWHFRAHPNGHEIGHGALYSAAGREYRVSDEVRRAGRDLKKCGDFFLQTAVKSEIALHYSTTAYNSFEYAPLIKGFHYRKTLVEDYYGALRHYNVDVIDTPHALDGYRVLVSPFLATADENGFYDRVKAWIKAGGVWIVGPMSDIMDENISRYPESPYGILEELAGVYTKYQKPVDNQVFRAAWQDGSDCKVSGCFDAYECLEGTKSLAAYVGGEFNGLSVVTERAYGKGKIVLVGSILSHAGLLRLIGIEPIAEASPNLILTERTGEKSGLIAVETEGKLGELRLDGEYRELITGRTLGGRVQIQPYEALVLQK